MMRKWTIIDTIIVVVIAIAVTAGVVLLGGGKKSVGEKSKVEILVLATDKEKGFSDSIKVGEEIIISLSEKDTGVVKKVESSPSKLLTFNDTEGIYYNNEQEDKEDSYIYIEAECVEDDHSVVVGETILKVGSYIAVRGKGYATEGHIVALNVGGENNDKK